jgi:phospholipid/cholesterol/gamma-HCH transport system substrate-binding protein
MFGRPVGKQRSRLFMISVGIFGLLLAAATFYIGYQAAYSVPGRGYYNLHGELANAENLSNHYEIRSGGVRIGQVLNPRVEHGKAIVDMRIDDRYKPLRSDTQLRIRLRSAVGVRYLEVIPGTKGTPLPEGATIPASNARTPVALDKVLDTFDTRTRARTRDLLNELGAGVQSRGADLNQAIASAPHFLGSLQGFSGAVVERRDAMANFIAGANRAAGAFDGARDEIGTGFKPESEALKPFNDDRGDVQATLAGAAPALATLRTQLPAVSGLLDEVGHFATATRPTFQAAPAALRSTTALVNRAARPLGDAKKTLDLASGAVNPALDLLRAAHPVLPGVERGLSDVVPTLQRLAPRACDMTQFATGWAEYIKWGDSYESMIRFLVAAVRPEQPVGQNNNVSKIPAPGGGDAYDGLINKDPYPAQCVNGTGEAGFEQPTEQESVRGESYSSTNLPGGKG